MGPRGSWKRLCAALAVAGAAAACVACGPRSSPARSAASGPQQGAATAPPPEVSGALRAFLAQPHTTLLAEATHALASAYVAEPLQPLPRRRFEVFLSVLRDAPTGERDAALAILGDLRHWSVAIAGALWNDGPALALLSPVEEENLITKLTSGTRAETTALYSAMAALYLGRRKDEPQSPWVLRLSELAKLNRCPVLPLRDWDRLAGRYETGAGGTGDAAAGGPVPCTPTPAFVEMVDVWHYKGPEVLFADLDAGRVPLEEAIPHVLAPHGEQAVALWPTEAVVRLVRRVRTLPAEKQALGLVHLPALLSRVEPTSALFDATFELMRDVPVGSRWNLIGFLMHERREGTPARAFDAELPRFGRQELLPHASGRALSPGLSPEDALLLFARTRREGRVVREYVAETGVLHLEAYDFWSDAGSANSVLWPEEKSLYAPLLRLCTEASRAHERGIMDPQVEGGCSSVVTKAMENGNPDDLVELLLHARGMFLLRLAGETFLAGKSIPREVRTGLAENPITRAPFFDFLKAKHVSAAVFPAGYANEKAMLESVVAREVALALGGPPDEVERVEPAAAKGRSGHIEVRFRVRAPRAGAERGWMLGVVRFTGRDLRASKDAVFFTRYSGKAPESIGRGMLL